jgi:RNA polymerase sigma-70 factor (ECF subfamily)
MGTKRLASVFLAHWAQGATQADASLEQSLAEALRLGREAWSALSVADTDFAVYLATRVRRGVDPAREIRNLHAQDLFLCCACAGRDPNAIRALHMSYLDCVPRYLERMNLSAAEREEVREALAERLLVGSGGAAGRIAEYAGRGPLAGWIRVAAVRTALNQIRRARRHMEAVRRAEAATPPTPDLELEILKHHHRSDFELAFRDALATLDQRGRSLLRLRYLEELGLRELAALKGVHRETIRRWLAAAEEAVFAETRRLLAERLRLSPSSCDSLLEIVRTQLATTLHSLLASSNDLKSRPAK